jgi:hypothetical protein
MAEEEDGLGGVGFFGAGAEAGFEHIAESRWRWSLTRPPNSWPRAAARATQASTAALSSEGDSTDQLAGEVEQARTACGGLRPAGRAWE